LKKEQKPVSLKKNGFKKNRRVGFKKTFFSTLTIF